jgi:hypothetical protein
MGIVSRTLSAKPPLKPVLKTPSSSLASMLKWCVSMTSPLQEIRIWANCAWGPQKAPVVLLDGLGRREGETLASSGSHPISSPSVLQNKHTRLAQRLRRWMARLGPSVPSPDPFPRPKMCPVPTMQGCPQWWNRKAELSLEQHRIRGLLHG